jgi:hypothetical protein
MEQVVELELITRNEIGLRYRREIRVSS